MIKPCMLFLDVSKAWLSLLFMGHSAYVVPVICLGYQSIALLISQGCHVAGRWSHWREGGRGPAVA